MVSRVLEIFLHQIEGERQRDLRAILAGGEEVQVLDPELREIAKVLLVRDRPRVLQHRVRGRRALRSALVAHRIPL